MNETPTELRALQDVLDRSYETAGAHLRSTFALERRVSAIELVESLSGIFEMHLATIASDGAPLAAPIDGVLFGGKVWFGLPSGSIRRALVCRDPRVSASYTRGESFAFILHGVAREVNESDLLFEAYERFIREQYVRLYGTRWIKWRERQHAQTGRGYTAWIEPRRMYAKH